MNYNVCCRVIEYNVEDLLKSYFMTLINQDENKNEHSYRELSDQFSLSINWWKFVKTKTAHNFVERNMKVSDEIYIDLSKKFIKDQFDLIIKQIKTIAKIADMEFLNSLNTENKENEQDAHDDFVHIKLID